MREIRPYGLFDLADLLRLWEVAARQSHPFLSDRFFLRKKYDIPNGYIPNSKTWVAAINGKVVGFISLLGNEVAALFVDPDYQHLGVGRALLDTVTPLCEEVTLEVFEANTQARAFYKAYGFKETSRRQYEDTAERLLHLTLDASTP